MHQMRTVFAISLVASACYLSPTKAQDASWEDQFETPIELLAGGEEIKGTGYPSPTLFDVDGDGTRELCVGDIFGNIYLAKPSDDANPQNWSPMSPMQSDGQPLRLNNW